MSKKIDRKAFPMAHQLYPPPPSKPYLEMALIALAGLAAVITVAYVVIFG